MKNIWYESKEHKNEILDLKEKMYISGKKYNDKYCHFEFNNIIKEYEKL